MINNFHNPIAVPTPSRRKSGLKLTGYHNISCHPSAEAQAQTLHPRILETRRHPIIRIGKRIHRWASIPHRSWLNSLVKASRSWGLQLPCTRTPRFRIPRALQMPLGIPMGDIGRKTNNAFAEPGNKVNGLNAPAQLDPDPEYRYPLLTQRLMVQPW